MQTISRIVNIRLFALITMKDKKLLDCRALRARKDEENDVDCRALRARKDEENDVDCRALCARKDEEIDVDCRALCARKDEEIDVDCRALRARKDEDIAVTHSSWRAQPAAIILLVCLIGSFGIFTLQAEASPFSGGDGTAEDPYIITTPAQLDDARKFSGAHFKLGCDIDLSSYLAPDGAGYTKWGRRGWLPIGTQAENFTGSFDGAGHVITGLWINRPNEMFLGLFAYTRKAVIKNLGVEIDAKGVSGTNYVGGLMGYKSGGRIENSFNTGDVNGRYSVGGLVGWQYDGSIINSYATGNVRGDSSVGGLVGYQSGGSIENSYAAGDVEGENSIGGLAGHQYGGNIEDSYSIGSVKGVDLVGGLVGWQTGGRIGNSYTTSDVSGTDGIGGLVGKQPGGSIENCYATGSVNGRDDVGGLVGSQKDGIITNCCRYINQMVNGAVLPTNDPDNSPDIKHGGVKTADELMTQETYTDNGWLIYPSGPWHWDSGGFPKLNLGTENFPFDFTPKIEKHPMNRTVAAGNIVTFSVTAIREEPFSYQWQRLDDGITWSNVGTNSETYSFTAQTTDDGAQFRVIASNKHGSVISNTAILTVGTTLPLGNGVAGDPYIITTPAQLDEARNYLDAHFKLGGDIDLSPYLAPGGAGCDKWEVEGWLPIGTKEDGFTGSFDGAGYVIKGLWINRSNTDIVGLFGLANDAVIKNLGVEIAEAGISGNNLTGGLVGGQLGGSIANSYTTGNVRGDSAVGGLAGGQSGIIANSYATGNVSGRGNSVGGLVGVKDEGIIENSYATGDVSGRGIAVSGLVGYQYRSNIENSYATGNVNGRDDVGGLVGHQQEGSTITNCYRYVNQMINGVVIPENDPDSAPDRRHGGIKTSAELMTQETYIGAGWQFSPSGPWHWDSRGFPKLNVGAENNPFKFTLTIVNHPHNWTVTAGSTATFSVTASGDAPLSYQWQRQIDGNTWSDVGTNSDIYSFTAHPTDDGASFRVVVSNYYGANISDVAILTVKTTLPVGAGTAGDPYIVTTPTQLDAVRNFSDAHYKLGANINLSSYLAQGGEGFDKWGAEGWLPIGTKANPFTGSFDGDGYVITGLWINRSSMNYVGLFGFTRNAMIANTGIEVAAAGIRGDIYVGGIVGEQFEGRIENSYAMGDVSGRGSSVGGLVGCQSGGGSIVNIYGVGRASGSGDVGGPARAQSNRGSITNSYAMGDVSGSGNVGGLVGSQSEGSITNSYATGNASGGNAVGGLVGYQFGGSIEDSYAMGNVSGRLHSIGGLVGYQFGGNIENSYATGNVNGRRNSVGGLVGSQSGSVTRSYARGSVSGREDVGGLVGSQKGSITYSYATGNVDGYGNSIGGLVGSQQEGSIITNCYRYMNIKVNGEGISESDPDSAPDKKHGGVKTAAELTTQETYTEVGWLFYPSGPWHWDSRGFPKLNSGAEDVPFFTPVITNHPKNRTVAVENKVVFSVSVSGETTPSYQWQRRDDGDTWSNVGTNSDIHSFTAQTTDDGAQFRVIASNNHGSVISSTAVLTVGTTFHLGNGTADDPYVITNPDQLDEMRKFTDANYKLSCDIDLSSYLEPGGAGYDKWGADGWLPIGTTTNPFTVNFDGAGHVIKGLWINRSDTYYVGLFGYTRNAVITNIGVEITAAGVKGEYAVGGLIGYQYGGIIENSFVKGNVSGEYTVGVLVGNQDEGSIENCYTTGGVSGGDAVGGLVGRQDGGSIENCYTTGDVSGYVFVGGLVGEFEGIITNSYATGDVDGSEVVGGLVGSQSKGSIANSYATGDVRGFSSTGALVGKQEGGSVISNCYRYNNLRVNDGTVMLMFNLNSAPNKIHGGVKAAAELMTQDTYIGNGWLFYPSGPWHWDSRGFPKLNLGTENFPFNF